MNADWTSLLTDLAEGRDLDRLDVAAAMTEVLEGRAEPARLAAFLMGLRGKGESDAEILGLADAMLAHAEPLRVPNHTVDIVGTGGTRHRRTHALNVSSMASFVAAAAGATVCKHGNVAASSTSGSFDFLARIGVDINVSPAQVEQQLVDHRLAFAWAKTFHPAMRHAGAVRSALGIPTVFNLLGPLVHPGGVTHIVLGVADEKRAAQLARVLFDRGMDSAWVIAGHDGFDELSTVGANRVWVVDRQTVSERVVHPREAGMGLSAPADLAGGSADENARLFTSLIDEPDQVAPIADIVVLNAAAALVVSGARADLASAADAARHALTSGRVQELHASFTTRRH